MLRWKEASRGSQHDDEHLCLDDNEWCVLCVNFLVCVPTVQSYVPYVVPYYQIPGTGKNVSTFERKVVLYVQEVNCGDSMEFTSRLRRWDESPVEPILDAQLADFWFIVLIWSVIAWFFRLLYLLMQLLELKNAMRAAQVAVHRNVPLHSEIGMLDVQSRSRFLAYLRSRTPPTPAASVSAFKNPVALQSGKLRRISERGTEWELELVIDSMAPSLLQVFWGCSEQAVNLSSCSPSPSFSTVISHPSSSPTTHRSKGASSIPHVRPRGHPIFVASVCLAMAIAPALTGTTTPIAIERRHQPVFSPSRCEA